jgi:hypothetical protein
MSAIAVTVGVAAMRTASLSALVGPVQSASRGEIR